MLSKALALRVTIACLVTWPFLLRSQTTVFTYQGRLNQENIPANGLYEFSFTLLGDRAATNLGPVITKAVAITNGLFTVPLDFGSVAFDGSDLWLQVAVRTNGANTFTNLAPLQPLTAAPYAITARNAATLQGTLASVNFGGAYSNSVAFSSPSNTFIGSFNGNARGLTNLPIGRINVKDFGATGNGYIDDSAAIRAALNVWLNSGDTLYFPAGDYLDTNQYVLQGTAPILVWNSGGLYKIAGAGATVTRWKAAITNGTFLNCAPGGVSGDTPPDIENITIQNVGSGSNNCMITIGGPLGPLWRHCIISGFTGIGAAFDAISSGYFEQVDFDNCYIGLKVPGFCDGWRGRLILRGCTNGLVIGGENKFSGNQVASGGQWSIAGNHNYAAVVVHGSLATTISGALESSAFCAVCVGNPGTLPPSDDSRIGYLTVQNLYQQAGNTALVRLMTNVTALHVQGCPQVAAGSVLVQCDTPAADKSPMIITDSDGEYATVKFSDGSIIRNSAMPLVLNQSLGLFGTANKLWSVSASGNVSQSGYLYSSWPTNGPKWWLLTGNYDYMGLDVGSSSDGNSTIGIGHGSYLGGTMVDDLTVSENGNVSARGRFQANSLWLTGSTNQIVFGGETNAPADASSPTKWIPVQIQGDPNVYRLPVYR